MRIELAGGIGNQLFQIVAAELLACTFPDEKVNLSATPVHGNRNHGFSPSMDFIERFLGAKSKIEQLDSVHLGQRLERYFFKPKNRRVLDEIGRVNLQELQGFERIKGYFQTHVYPDTLMSLGQYSLGFNCFATSQDATFGPKVCGIHIRRGDYERHRQTIGLLSRDYFETAIGAATEAGFEHFVIFSDSLSEIENVVRLTKLPSYEFIPGALSPIQTLSVASKLKGMILSNSSFSWWAAYPNHDDKIVFFPSRWYRSIPEPESLIPRNWTPVASRWVG